MTARTLFATAALTAALAAPASAQDAPPTLLVSSWRCDRGAVDDIVERMRERDMPIAQALVNEGRMWGYHVMRHAWGDEWNLVTFTIASDLNAGIAAGEEATRRYEEAHGEDTAFLEACDTHRDQIYTGAWITEEMAGANWATPFAMALSYFACPFNSLGSVVTAQRELVLPAAQEAVNAGSGLMAAAMTHAWADEWTYVTVRAARDLPTLFEFNDAVNDAAGARAPAGATPALDACRLHKDNLYEVVLATRDRE